MGKSSGRGPWNHWNFGRELTDGTGDVVPTNEYLPSLNPDVGTGGTFSVDSISQIAIIGYSSNASDTESMLLKLMGWMDNGPGIWLVSITGTFGPTELGAAEKFHDGPTTNADFRFVEKWALTAGDADNQETAGVYKDVSGAGGEEFAMAYVNTSGFKKLRPYIAPGDPFTNYGFLWRPTKRFEMGH